MVPLWLQYLQVLAVLLVPAIGAWIAWRQVQIARVKLQHDLYDRRFAVFEAARKLLVEVITHGDVSNNSLTTYAIATADAIFLLDDPKLCEHLKEIRKRSSILHTIKFTMEPLPAGDQKAALSKQASEHLLWLNDQLDVLVEHFKPFLMLERRGMRSPEFATMNIRRGLFRTWVIGSVVWIGINVWSDDFVCLFRHPACISEWKVVSPFWATPEFQFVQRTLGIPVIMFVAGLAINWAMRGFRR